MITSLQQTFAFLIHQFSSLTNLLTFIRTEHQYILRYLHANKIIHFAVQHYVSLLTYNVYVWNIHSE